MVDLGDGALMNHLCDLFYIDDVFGIIGIRTYDLCASSNLHNRMKHIIREAMRKHKLPTQLEPYALERLMMLMMSGGHLSPAMVAPPASSVYLIQDPTGLVEPIQCQTPLSL
jgi:hypothetical protein